MEGFERGCVVRPVLARNTHGDARSLDAWKRLGKTGAVVAGPGKVPIPQELRGAVKKSPTHTHNGNKYA